MLVTAVNIMMNLPSNVWGEQFKTVYYVHELMADVYRDAPWLNTYLTNETMMGHTAVESGMHDGQTLFQSRLRSFLSKVTVIVVISLSIVRGLGVSGLTWY